MLEAIFNPIDRLLNKITSYRLVLYFLISLLGSGLILSFLGILTFSPFRLLYTALLLVAACRGANLALARVLNVSKNQDSDLITALILALIFNPVTSGHEILVLVFAGVFAMGSKYFLAPDKKHVFNPAAYGAFIVATLFNRNPSWWVGNKFLLPIIVVGGFLILRKMKRFSMSLGFVGLYATLLAISIFSSTHGLSTYPAILGRTITDSPLLFFGLIMLTEPLTSPSSRRFGFIYVAIVGLLYATPQLRVLSISLEPVSALMFGNIFTYLVSPHQRMKLKFLHKTQEASGIYSFAFSKPSQLNFEAGQYMEWTLPVFQSDNRGNRRYLTIASAPSESQLMFSVKIPEKMSSFKNQLLKLEPGNTILASELVGQFVLPEDIKRKLCFIAGGIGITPFRSMVKQIGDTGQNRTVTLLYFASDPKEFAFNDIFAQAPARNLRTIRSITNPDLVPPNWKGNVGPVSADMIKSNVPDYSQRLFYLSGPLVFVQATAKALSDLGVNSAAILTDFFPGY